MLVHANVVASHKPQRTRHSVRTTHGGVGFVVLAVTPCTVGCRRYLFYEQFLEMVFDFCGAGHGELPRTTWQLFNPDLQKVSPSKVGAIMRFVWGEDFGAKHPELHKWVLRVCVCVWLLRPTPLSRGNVLLTTFGRRHVDTFKQVRVEKLGRDDGREKRDKGEWVSTSELEEFLLRSAHCVLDATEGRE